MSLSLVKISTVSKGCFKLLHNPQEICGNHIKAGFFSVILQDIAVHGTND